MSSQLKHILLVDDDPEFIADFKLLLPDGLVCDSVESSIQAGEYILTNEPDVVFLDIDLGPHDNGMDLLVRLKDEYPYLPVIMITADNNTSTIVRAMQLGASDYVGKSPNLDKLRIAIEQAARKNSLQQRVAMLESELDIKIGQLIGDSIPMRNIRNQLAQLAKAPSNVFITGASGTGKELVAREIHRLSEKHKEPFIAVNCAALSPTIIESELFGHEKGAFTSAHARRIGKFELAGKGTLFLDEITEIPFEYQAKLLRVLQEREFERVGGNRLLRFHGRILASSNRDIAKCVENKELREDLLYRLWATRIHLPPLSERRDDIPRLAEYFLKKFATEMKKNISGITEPAMNQLCSYQWPGNVRDLSNCIESAVVHSDTPILDVGDISRMPMNDCLPTNYEEAKQQVLHKFKINFITAMLKLHDGNVSRTAQEMGLSRQGLKKMMDECGLS